MARPGVLNALVGILMLLSALAGPATADAVVAKKQPPSVAAMAASALAPGACDTKAGGKARSALQSDLLALAKTLGLPKTKTKGLKASASYGGCTAAGANALHSFTLSLTAKTGADALGTATALVPAANAPCVGPSCSLPALANSSAAKTFTAGALPKTVKQLGAGSVVKVALAQSTVIAMYADPGVSVGPGNKQPYPRGLMSRSLSVQFGNGSAANNITFTSDTGSGLFILTCNVQGIGPACNPTVTGSVTVTSQNALTAAQCANTGLGCTTDTGGPAGCYFTQGLTGGNGFNGNAGQVASSAVGINNVVGATGPVQLQATLACSQYKFTCNETDTTCLNVNQQCPLNVAGQQCHYGSAFGIEAGWTFAFNSSVAGPSSIAVPQQAYDQGLMSQRTLGFCWVDLPWNQDCAAAAAWGPGTLSGSYHVLGPQLPDGLNYTSMASAPLLTPPQSVFSPPNSGPTAASTQEFRTGATAAAVPTLGGGATNFTMPANSTVLWDTGAYGQFAVPQDVFNAYSAYFQAALQAYSSNSSRQFNVTGCNATSMCGSNIAQNNSQPLPQVCQQVALPANADAQTIAAASAVLRSLYPAYINVTLVGPGNPVVSFPGVAIVHDCVGGATAHVAACSYPQPGSHADNVWVAAPFFQGRFVQFDVSAPAQGYPNSWGTMWFTPGGSSWGSCNFASTN